MLAPEPYITVYLELLEKTIIYARGLSLELSNKKNNKNNEQITDLLDAIHVIPELLNKWEQCDEKSLRSFLEKYDRKWVKSSFDFSMMVIYNKR